jgi:hypothetical protein
MKITTIKQAIHFFWVKTLSSGKRILSVAIQLNYLVILVLILLKLFVLTWEFMVFLVISLIGLLIIEGLIPVAPVETKLNFGNNDD